MAGCKKCCEINTVHVDFFKCSREIMTISQKKWLAGNDAIMKQTCFNIYMPETKKVL